MMIVRGSLVEVLNVVVIADHDVAREGLVSVLDGVGGLAVVAEMGYGRDLVDVLTDAAPDVVVLDHSPPLGDAMDLCKALHDAGVAARIVILVDDPNADSVEAALAGARACLSKDARSDHLVEAVRAAALGTEGGSSPFQREREGVPHLGGSQTTVLRLLVEGKSVREIAEAMALSRHTVRSYLRQIYRRLGVSSRAEAATAAVRLRLI